jgi:signal transduction histidine kinase
VLSAGLATVLYHGRVQRLVAREHVRTLEEVNRDLEQRVALGIDRLRATERLAAYGQLVAGVAHEVRHPVFALRAAAYLIAQKAGELGPDLATPIRTLREETDRMSRLMEDLVQFSREPVLARATIDPSELLETTAASFRAAHGDGLPAIVVEVEPGLPQISIDRDRMIQVLLNLAVNARRHAGGVTRIVLGAARRADGGVRLRIANDGRGIDPAVLPRIFEPFYTGGGGTGLGLAIVDRIVRTHGATIAVESGLAAGTSFTIDLPAA